MSKVVSYTVNFRSGLLQLEDLHTCVMSVWNYERHKFAMAKLFAVHPQIVCAILDHEGNNRFLHEKQGLLFRVQRAYHLY